MVRNAFSVKQKGAPPKKKSAAVPGTRNSDAFEVMRAVLGCKWTLHVLSQIRTGVVRPGALLRTAQGLTSKVLNERLSKLVRLGILEKIGYPEVPPRVEYKLTTYGKRLERVIVEIDRLGTPPKADV